MILWLQLKLLKISFFPAPLKKKKKKTPKRKTKRSSSSSLYITHYISVSHMIHTMNLIVKSLKYETERTAKSTINLNCAEQQVRNLVSDH